MSGGLVAYGVICFIGVIIFTAYLVWRFARPGTPIPVLFLTYLSWLIVFSICFLVPIDLFPGAEESLNDVWSTLFWCSFLLMWIIIPFASGYYDNGGFTVKHKMWMSLKFNGILVLIVTIIGVAGVIYLTAAAKWSMSEVSGLLICLSNAWGLTMLVLCAGFGLVEVPRSIYYLGQYNRRTDFIYFNATYISHEADDTRDELAATIALLDLVEKKVEKSGNDKHQRWMIEIRNVVRERELEMQSSNYRSHPYDFRLADELKSSEKVSTNQMFSLHYHAKTLVRHLSLVETQWRDTVNDAVELEKELTAQSDPHQISWWLKTGRKRSYLVFAVIGAILSLLLVFGEITISTSDNVSPLAWIVQAVKDNFLLQQIFTAIPLLYLSICTYYPLFQLRLSKLYYIGRRRTDEGSLLFNATFLLRAATPLAYNFVLLLRIPARSLENLIGPVTNIPFFGTSFTEIFPMFIAVLNLLVLFNVFGRIGAFLGIVSMKFSVVDRLMDDDVKSQIREGRTLIQNELRKRQKEIKASQSGSGTITASGVTEKKGKQNTAPTAATPARKGDIEMGKKGSAPAPAKAAPVQSDEYDDYGEDQYEDQHHELDYGLDDNQPIHNNGMYLTSSDGGFQSWGQDGEGEHEDAGFDFDPDHLESQMNHYHDEHDHGEYDEAGNLIR